MDTNVFYHIFIATVFELTSAIPPEYCHMPANLSDCGKKPMAIFSYYRPGSRCELEIWRGCPTLNKFRSQYECHDHCVYQALRQGISQDEAYHIKYGGDSIDVGEEGTPDPHVDLSPRCRQDLNTSKACSDIESAQLVYTYDTTAGKCQEKTWYHCRPSENKFDSDKECAEVCLGAEIEWKVELHKLDAKEAEKLNEAVDEAVENVVDNQTGNQNEENEHKGSPHGPKTNDNLNHDSNGSNDGHIIENNDKNNDDTGDDEGTTNNGDISNGENYDENKDNNRDDNEHKSDNDGQTGKDKDDKVHSNTNKDRSDIGNDDNKIIDDDHSGGNGENKDDSEESSGEQNYTQVIYATTHAQTKKLKFKKYSLNRRSDRLLKFLNGIKDYYVL